MIIINPNLRITQYYNKKHFSVSMPKETYNIIDINQTVYNLLRAINEGKISTIKDLNKIVVKSVIHDLFEKKIIINSKEYIKNENVLDQCNVKYPLHAITIEVTNACDLNCIHCYGKFGKPGEKRSFSYKELVELKKDLDCLHTQEIRLSGGECFLNPDFDRIALFFLENGFKVSIYTNGFETKKILNFVELTKQYHYFIGISLDGTEKYHNTIRGNNSSYKKTIDTLQKLKEFQNIDVLIATSIMKQNYENIDEIKKVIKDEFPEYLHHVFLASPVNGTDFAYDYNELPHIMAKCPELFDDYLPGKKNSFLGKKRHRCQGGVGHAVLTANGILKICPIAEEEEFVLGDIKNSSLYKVWNNPKGRTQYYRDEYEKCTPQCKKCKSKRACGYKNCRIEALRLTGSSINANPYTCMVIKGKYDSIENRKVK